MALNGDNCSIGSYNGCSMRLRGVVQVGGVDEKISNHLKETRLGANEDQTQRSIITLFLNGGRVIQITIDGR